MENQLHALVAAAAARGDETLVQRRPGRGVRVGVAALHFEPRAAGAQERLYFGALLFQLVNHTGAARLVLRGAGQVNKLPVAKSGLNGFVVARQVNNAVVGRGPRCSPRRRWRTLQLLRLLQRR